MLRVKSKQMEAKTELNTVWEELMAVSYTENPTKWSELFTKATNRSVRLADITRELSRLERKISV